MSGLTADQIIQVAAVVIILLGAYNTIMNAIKNHREEKRLKNSPLAELTNRVDKHDTLLANDKKRIDEMDNRIEKIDLQSTIMLRGVRALLSHEVNGNSTDKLKGSLAEIDDYLIERK